MNQITDNIWLGNSQDAKDLGALKSNGIFNILNVAEDLPPALGWKDGIKHFHIGLCDGVNHAGFYDSSYCCLRAITNTGKVLVHCHEGASRSAFVVAFYLGRERSVDIPSGSAWVDETFKAIQEIKSKRPQTSINRGHYISLGITPP